MAKHVIIGAGPVGTEVAKLLSQQGEQVVVVTRSGSGPDRPGVQRSAADASDSGRLIELSEGAVSLYNCANPRHYGTWETVWPALSASLLVTAEATGATLATASSLYAYGPVEVPMTEQLPDVAAEKNGAIRARMWAEANAAHEAGRVHAVEVRASDYVGAGLGQNSHLCRNVAGALQGKRAWVSGDPDLPHSWTDVLDVARTLVAVAARPEAWGRVWLAPTNEPRSHRQALSDVLSQAGKPMVAMSSYPAAVFTLGGVVNADLRQLAVMGYIFARPYTVDSTAVQTELGLAPTPWDEVCRRSRQVG